MPCGSALDGFAPVCQHRWESTCSAFLLQGRLLGATPRWCLALWIPEHLGVVKPWKAASIPSFHAIGNLKTMALLVETDQSTMLSWSKVGAISRGNLRNWSRFSSQVGLISRRHQRPRLQGAGLGLVPLLNEMDLLLGCRWNGPVCLQPVCLLDFNGFAQNSVLAPPVLTIRECAEGLGSGNHIFLHHTRDADSLDLEGCCKWPQPGNWVVLGVSSTCHSAQPSPPGRCWPTPREVSQGLCRVAALALPPCFCIYFPPFPLPVITFLPRPSFLYLWIVVNSLNFLFLSWSFFSTDLFAGSLAHQSASPFLIYLLSEGE